MTENRKALEEAIEKTRETNPRWAEFVETSFQEELDAGVRESLAASNWIGKITGRAAA